MSKKMTCDERVLAYIKKFGGITPMEAWNAIGIYRLSGSIFNLRKAGYCIETNLVDVRNRYGDVCKVARYTLC